jgi:Tol biopolymer transport system component
MNITRVSVDSAGNESDQGNQDSYPFTSPSISPDGRFVAFYSNAYNLVAEDTNDSDDIFVRDTLTNTTTRLSVDSAGNQANSGSESPSISADGRFVAFDSKASNLVPGDTNYAYDIFVRDTLTNTTTRVSVDSAGNQAELYKNSGFPSISADGRLVAFSSKASNLVPGDTNNTSDIFVRDTLTNTTTRVSVDSAGNQGNKTSFEPFSLSGSSDASISADGRFVAFYSYSSNLVPGDTNNTFDIFVRDMLTNTTTRLSVDSAGNQANSGSGSPFISADGRFVVFESNASNLVPGDTNDADDIFVRDTLTNTTTRVSVDSAGNQALGDSSGRSISANGRFVVFSSYSSNLVPGDTNDAGDIFVRDTLTNTTTRLSVDSAGKQGNHYSYNPSISADGRFVAFESRASNLVPGDTNNASDVFVSDIGSTSGNNPPDNNINGILGNNNLTGTSGNNIINAVEGNNILIDLGANDIVVGDGGGGKDVFVLDVAARFEIDTSADFTQSQDIVKLIDGLTFGQLSISPGLQDPLIEVANSGEVLASLIALLLISLVLKISFRSRA